ncbi:MAG: tRNA lysidine(34) synthetase TilS [Streptosporangiaceae bacterium]
MGPDPAVAAARLAVRRCLADARRGDLVLAACSGGADSLALAAALGFEAPRLGLRAGAVTVDHGLQPGSAAQAARVRETLAGLGLDPVRAVRVAVTARGEPGYPGPEAAARRARYAAMDAAAEDLGAAVILLGHTMDDQAETVLLGLVRGSGPRSIAGMAPVSGRYRRPLLGLRREQTRTACLAAGLTPWDDPQNDDLAFARTRVRQRALPMLADLLGPGVIEALARTADQVRADADLIDGLTDAAGERIGPPGASRAGLEVAALAALPGPIRTRLLRRAAVAAGAPPGSLTAAHVAGLDALVMHWRGQRGTDLPGGLRCSRRYGRLQFTART